MRSYLLFVLALFAATSSPAQLLKNIKKAVTQRAEEHTVQKAEQAVDNLFTKKTKPAKDTALMPNTTAAASAVVQDSMPFAVYSKFDFVAGAQLVAFEDFSGEPVGDFPAAWNTNASGEVVTIANQPGKWLKLDAPGVYMPEFIKSLPDNFTLEFDLLCNPGFRYGSSPFFFAIASLSSPQDYTMWLEGNGGRKGFNTWILPMAANGKSGRTGFQYYNNNGQDRGEFETAQLYAPVKNKVRVSVWRQKQRIRVYLDEQKLIDVAKALNTEAYNALVFSLNSAKTAPDHYLISNIRLAVGQPDTRNKLLTEGRLVTSAIRFAVNSDRIEPSSYPVLKEIAQALQAAPAMRIQITGHTDSDGEAAANKILSEKRAVAVKEALVKEFSIAADRLQTGGKGESAPVAENNTATGKAQNRRVEFVKLPN
jgi:outer membrane protein OmpA-like peptidoglycan-associated protein